MTYLWKIVENACQGGYSTPSCTVFSGKSDTHIKRINIFAQKRGISSPLLFSQRKRTDRSGIPARKMKTSSRQPVSPMVSNTRQSPRTHEDSLRAHRRLIHFWRVFVLMLLLKLFHGVNGILSKRTLRDSCSNLSKTRDSWTTTKCYKSIWFSFPKKAGEVVYTAHTHCKESVFQFVQRSLAGRTISQPSCRAKDPPRENGGEQGSCRHPPEYVFLQVISSTTFPNDIISLLVHPEHLMGRSQYEWTLLASFVGEHPI